MPVLPNPRHERFAQELAKGKSASEAYKLAGYKANDGNAATLKGNQRVLERVAELQKQAAARTGVTVERLTDDLLRIAAKAEADGSSSGLNAARQACMDVAKLNGLIIDKAEVAQTIRDVSDEPLSADEWAEQHAGEVAH